MQGLGAGWMDGPDAWPRRELVLLDECRPIDSSARDSVTAKTFAPSPLGCSVNKKRYIIFQMAKRTRVGKRKGAGRKPEGKAPYTVTFTKANLERAKKREIYLFRP